MLVIFGQSRVLLLCPVLQKKTGLPPVASFTNNKVLICTIPPKKIRILEFDRTEKVGSCSK